MKKRKVISAQLSDDVRGKFEKIAERSGLGEAWWVGKLIEKLVGEDDDLFHDIWFDYTETIKESKPMKGQAQLSGTKIVEVEETPPDQRQARKKAS